MVHSLLIFNGVIVEKENYPCVTITTRLQKGKWKKTSSPNAYARMGYGCCIAGEKGRNSGSSDEKDTSKNISMPLEVSSLRR